MDILYQMNKFERVFVLFDTNVLESRHDGKSMFLSQVRVPQNYFELIRIIQEFSLSDKIKLCIPDIVLKELKRQMIDCFKSEKQSLIDIIEKSKRTFGDLLELEYAFKCKDHNEYETIAEESLKSFFSDAQRLTNILEIPITEGLIRKLIDKAINAETPFMKPKVSNSQKEYTDAGFKDALIYETFIANIDNESLCLFVSNDSDFEPLFHDTEENIKLCKSIDNVINYIKQNFGITIKEDLIIKFKDNYLLNRVIELAELDVREPVKLVSILKITENNATSNSSSLSIRLVITIQSEEFVFDVEYDIMANEVLNSMVVDPEELQK